MPWISNPRIDPPEVHGTYVKLQRIALAHIKLKIASCILQFVYKVYKLYIILYIIVCSNLHRRKKILIKNTKILFVMETSGLLCSTVILHCGRAKNIFVL